jgi:hypothetical protein
MAIVPEILWSPVVNYYYSVLFGNPSRRFFRVNYFTENVDPWSWLILFQLAGVILLLGYVIMSRKSFERKNFYLYLVLSVIFALILFVAHSLVNFSQHIKISI